MKQKTSRGKTLPKRCLKLIHLSHPDLSGTWLDTGDVMRLLHCSERTLQTLRKKAGLPYYEVHQRLYLYKLEEVQAFVEQRKHKANERTSHD